MNNQAEANITRAVVDSFAATPDPRLREIMTAMTESLHDFVKRVEPTFAEWEQAIAFLTRTGQTCTDTRQEFILLSDTLGVSMLVDAINHRMPEGATESTVLGPFYVQAPPELPAGSDISNGMAGDPLHCRITVRSSDGAALEGAIVDVWQADAEGFYDVQMDQPFDHALRARFRTDASGALDFWSVNPAHYPIPADGPVGEMLAATARHPYRPAHIHFMISHPGHETLVTHLFVEGSPYLDNDTVFGVKQELIVPVTPMPADSLPPERRAKGNSFQATYDFGLKAHVAAMAD